MAGASPTDADRHLPLRVLVLIGVSGSGKTTVGALLAGRLGWDFADGDDLHPPANVEKMASGQPLDDDDRRPWLANVADWIRSHVRSGRPGVITCSALKRAYRERLRADGVVFVHLAGSRDVIRRRLVARHGHYMPATLLDSQFDTLEPPTDEPDVLSIDIGPAPSEIIDHIIDLLGLPAIAGSGQR